MMTRRLFSVILELLVIKISVEFFFSIPLISLPQSFAGQDITGHVEERENYFHLYMVGAVPDDEIGILLRAEWNSTPIVRVVRYQPGSKEKGAKMSRAR